MTRRVLFVGLALAIVVGFGLAPAEAKGRCRAVLQGTVCCLRAGTDGIGPDFALPDRHCRTEGKLCNRDGSECSTLYAQVECVQVPCDGGTDGGGPSQVQVGLGCFCGGGSIGTGTAREDPVSAEDFLRMLEALDAEDTDAATCEAPPSLMPAIAQ